MAAAHAFRWNAWNLDKIDLHGVAVEEAEYVVNNARRPYPSLIAGAKWLVLGATLAGRWLHVIYLLEGYEVVFVIHARPLDGAEARAAQRNIENRRFGR